MKNILIISGSRADAGLLEWPTKLLQEAFTGATLNINGKKVTVDDSFLKLSPEEQNATVEEIAASLPKTQGPQGFMANAMDFVKSIPRGLVTGLTSAPNPSMVPGLEQEQEAVARRREQRSARGPRARSRWSRRRRAHC